MAQNHGRPPIGPKVQTQVYPMTYEYIRSRMREESRTEADVVRELIELGESLAKHGTLAESTA